MNTLKVKSFELAVYAKGTPDSEKLALVLPGRLDTKDYLHMHSHVDYLSSKKYYALSFDPPGAWESPGGIKLYTMTNYLKAINEIITHFGNKQTVLMGHSRGGSMAMLAGTQNKYVSHIIAAMSNSQPSQINKKLKDKDFAINYRDNPFGGKIKFELPLSYFEDAAQYTMLDALSKCSKPKLYFLGKKDTIVTPESVRNAYAKSANPKQLYEIDSGHDYRFQADKIEEINKVIGMFLDKQI
ncbi:MAG: alpha/beta hydrolase [Candidatus Diapherotrites archaeon]|nr:alpha/beta hydrolase [Candidatus Diapherotrites archaeon]